MHCALPWNLSRTTELCPSSPYLLNSRTASMSSLKLAGILLALWLAWRLSRGLLSKDPLTILPGPPSESLFIGNMMKLFDTMGWDYRDELVSKYGKVFCFRGIMQKRMLWVHDSKALYHMLIKDQEIFEEGEDFLRTNKRVFGDGLLSTLGEQHRKQRKMLNPVFSAAHLRDMTPTFYRIGHKLVNSVDRLVAQGMTEIDVLPWMSRTALELIGQSGFGRSFDTLEPDAVENLYAASIKKLSGTLQDPGLFFARLFIYRRVHNIIPLRVQRAIMDILPWKKLHELRDMVDLMHQTSIGIFDDAKRALNSGDKSLIGADRRKDIISTLIKANMSASAEDKLEDDELIGQVSTIMFAAMDTTSNALCRTLHLLSENPEVQNKLRDEVTEAYANGHGDLDYEVISNLPFLDAICRETLRLHTPVPTLARQARKDAVLPLGTPVSTTDGRRVNEIFVPQGTVLLMSPHHCNRDPDIWGADADEWKPERWLSDLPPSVAEARVPGVYSNLMTFIGGKRSCIGFKFSQLEMKVVLSLLIQKFEFRPSDKTIAWMANGVVQPTVQDPSLPGGGRHITQLPLKISVVAK